MPETCSNNFQYFIQPFDFSLVPRFDVINLDFHNSSPKRIKDHEKPLPQHVSPSNRKSLEPKVSHNFGYLQYLRAISQNIRDKNVISSMLIPSLFQVQKCSPDGENNRTRLSSETACLLCYKEYGSYSVIQPIYYFKMETRRSQWRINCLVFRVDFSRVDMISTGDSSYFHIHISAPAVSSRASIVQVASF